MFSRQITVELTVVEYVVGYNGVAQTEELASLLVSSGPRCLPEVVQRHEH